MKKKNNKKRFYSWDRFSMALQPICTQVGCVLSIYKNPSSELHLGLQVSLII